MKNRSQTSTLPLLVDFAIQGATVNFSLHAHVMLVAFVEGHADPATGAPARSLFPVTADNSIEDPVAGKNAFDKKLRDIVQASKASAVVIISEAWKASLKTLEEVDKYDKIGAQQHPDAQEVVAVIYEDNTGRQEVREAIISRTGPRPTLGPFELVPPRNRAGTFRFGNFFPESNKGSN